MEKKKIYETIENDVMNTELNEETKRRMLRNIMNLKNEKMNIMIVGATGCGKSSTINAPVSYTHLTLPTKRIV